MYIYACTYNAVVYEDNDVNQRNAAVVCGEL